MSETQEHDISDVPTDDDAVPIESRPRSRNDDAWYEYKGELLFEPARILDLWDTFQDMEEMDWDRVATLRTRPDTSRVKIRTKDTEACQEALNERANEVNEEIGFNFPKDALLGHHHGIHEEGPRKSVAWAVYNTGRHAGLGGAEYKREQILSGVMAFEQWLYHTKVWLPVVEKFNEKYPY